MYSSCGRSRRRVARPFGKRNMKKSKAESASGGPTATLLFSSTHPLVLRQAQAYDCVMNEETSCKIVFRLTSCQERQRRFHNFLFVFNSVPHAEPVEAGSAERYERKQILAARHFQQGAGGLFTHASLRRPCFDRLSMRYRVENKQKQEGGFCDPQSTTLSPSHDIVVRTRG
jgi:hypothetical protein